MITRIVRLALTAGLALAAATAGAAVKTHFSQPTSGDWRLDPRSGEPGSVQLELHREWSNGTSHGNSTNSFDVRRENLPGIQGDDWTAGNANVRFDLVRDAGTLHFDGTMRHGRGMGDFTFEPDSRFQDELERAGFRDIEPEDMMRLALHDIDRSWVRGFDGRHMTLDDLVRFKVHDVSPAFVKTMAAGGYRDLSGDDLVRLKVHQVDPEFVRQLGQLGYDRPSADDLVRLKVHGVDADYIRDLLSLASPKPTVDDMIRLHVHGVEAAYVRDMRDVGYDRLAADDLVRLKVHGVTPALARRAKSRFRDVSVDDLIRLKVRGEL